MEKAINEALPRFRPMAMSHDTIGWKRFLEVMILKEITNTQRQYYTANGSRMSLDKQCSKLITDCWILRTGSSFT
jgi:hypothetical protein